MKKYIYIYIYNKNTDYTHVTKTSISKTFQTYFFLEKITIMIEEDRGIFHDHRSHLYNT